MKNLAISAALAVLFTCASSAGQAPPPSTGPAVGAAIPKFSAVDQTGKTRAFDSLTGPNGLLLVFVRSADW